jgi:hypothetical protein
VAEPAIDIADSYVFANARPGAPFSDAANYRFRIRPVTIPAAGRSSAFEGGTDEYDMMFTFAAPVTTDGAGNPLQKGTGQTAGTLFAVAAETVALGKFPIRLERTGLCGTNLTFVVTVGNGLGDRL